MNALLALIEHTEDCDKFTGAGTACTCGADKAKDAYTELVNDNAALRARVGELERERDELQGLVFDISGWLSNWEPDFTEDDEWEDVAKRIDAALAKGAK